MVALLFLFIDHCQPDEKCSSARRQATVEIFKSLKRGVTCGFWSAWWAGISRPWGWKDLPGSSDSVSFSRPCQRSDTCAYDLAGDFYFIVCFFYICEIFYKNTHTQKCVYVFVKIRNLKDAFVLFVRAWNYICFTLLCCILPFVHFSGH